MATFLTGDGVELYYEDAGQGPVLLLLHGWSFSSAAFRVQIDGLQSRYRVIALDMRGHGRSAKPDHGYRIARLAADLNEFMAGLNLTDVRALGHSMGAEVLWAFWDLFGPARLAKLITVDQPAALFAGPGGDEEDSASTHAGAHSSAGVAPETFVALARDLLGPDGAAVREGFLATMVTGAISDAQKRALMTIAAQLPRSYAARLLLDAGCQDWRDVIPRLDLPTLIVGGRASQVPWQTQVWLQEQIPGARLEIFEENEGGAHLMFFEAPEKFNALVADFAA